MVALRAIPPLKDEIVDVLGLHYSFDVPAVREVLQRPIWQSQPGPLSEYARAKTVVTRAYA